MPMQCTRRAERVATSLLASAQLAICAAIPGVSSVVSRRFTSRKPPKLLAKHGSQAIPARGPNPGIWMKTSSMLLALANLAGCAVQNFPFSGEHTMFSLGK